ncbi:hypothetical protein NM208_g7728 [Fusarium decemcellulare]|uniref:Uncharacterized protein n=1 Tax=Fusarium decemcellulare TaxID=57161 RepID=A0ACC1S8I5_9HYPO|nr:hypothetical protein NM208_g7728 [Fusarium decemcellulare]
MATTGGCSCGNVTWSFEGEHIVSAICHCNRCKRNNGSLCSINLIVPAAGFKETTGKAKSYTSKGPSGNNGSSFFCENCGSPLYIKSDLGPGLVIIKAGSLDDVSLLEGKFKPSAEIFCETKLNFLPAVEGLTSFPGAMS